MEVGQERERERERERGEKKKAIIPYIHTCSYVSLPCWSFFSFSFFCFFRAAGAANRSSQARGQIGAIAASLQP